MRVRVRACLLFSEYMEGPNTRLGSLPASVIPEPPATDSRALAGSKLRRFDMPVSPPPQPPLSSSSTLKLRLKPKLTYTEPPLAYLATSGSSVSTAVMPTALTPIWKFMLLVLRRRAPAMEPSSILCRPDPSTSQSPPWATFHKPCFPLSRNPIDKARGKYVIAVRGTKSKPR